MSEVVYVTARQQEIYDFIGNFIDERSYPPKRQEIADHFGFSSLNGVQQHLRALEGKGLIRLVGGVSRGIVLL